MGFSRDHGPCKAAGRTQSPPSPQSFLRTTVNAEPTELAERRPPAPDGTTVDAEPAELAEGRPARDETKSVSPNASRQCHAACVCETLSIWQAAGNAGRCRAPDAVAKSLAGLAGFAFFSRDRSVTMNRAMVPFCGLRVFCVPRRGQRKAPI